MCIFTAWSSESSENQIEAEWTGYKDGKKSDAVLFLLTRK
jgi:hypothetical protein